ncbi:MAG TPA: TOMM precursor leader peptide-binding protein [Thermoanaerobaculia bacterium]
MILVGGGAVAEACAAALDVAVTIESGDALDPAMLAPNVVVLQARDHPAAEEGMRINCLVAASEARFLPLWLEFGEARLGPLVAGGRPGCLWCAEARAFEARKYKIDYRAALEKAAAEKASDPWRTGASLVLLARIVHDEIERQTKDVLYLNLSSLQLQRSRFLPVAACPICGSLPDDAPAHFVLAASQPALAGRWRVKDFTDQRLAIEEAFVDGRAGIATTVGVDITTPLCAVASARFSFPGVQQEDWTAGLTMSFARSEVVAMIEAVERYGGLRPRARRTVVEGTFRELAADALDPRSLTLYGPEQTSRPRFPCVVFDDDLRCSWVWGYSFGQQRPLLVPEQVAYYDAPYYPRRSLFLIDSSSGCATGGSLEEAIFYALLEVLERDAVLRTWYSRATPRRVDMRSVAAAELLLMIDRLHDTTGYELEVFDVTQEFGIPSLWALAVNPRADHHKCVSTSKAHPDPGVALSGALGELLGTLLYHRRQALERREELLKMEAESDRIIDRFDHCLVGGLPETFGRLDFLFRAAADTPFPSVDGRWRELSRDLAVAAQALIDTVTAAGFDVIAVDQTAPEQRPFGLSTVKVLVPGLLPMSYCHFLRRTTGSPRLQTVGEINPFPHPFA